MREGYRGTGLKTGYVEITGSITADLNNLKEDLPGQKPQDQPFRRMRPCCSRGSCSAA